MLTTMALLYTGFSYGQKNNEEANKKPDLLMVPQKTVTAEAQARDLAKQGWKSSQYTIEAQLSYTNALKCAIDTTSGEPAYLWIQSEISAPSLMDAKKKAFEFCREKLSRQFSAIVLSRCREVMERKKANEAQTLSLTQALNEIINRIVRLQMQESMEITKEKDNLVTIRLVMVVDKSAVSRILRGGVMSKFKDSADFQFYQDIINETLSPRLRPSSPKPSTQKK